MKQILRDFPNSFETERLTIRAPRAGDGPEANRAVNESLENLRTWLGWSEEAPTLEQSEINVRQAEARFLTREDLLWLLFLKGTNTRVGSCGLHRINWDVPKFEIGYWLRTSYTGQGYMTEAVAGITNFAFEHLSAKRVEIRLDERNLKSKAIPERLGYTQEARFVHDIRDSSGQLRNTLVYAIFEPVKNYAR